MIPKRPAPVNPQSAPRVTPASLAPCRPCAPPTPTGKRARARDASPRAAPPPCSPPALKRRRSASTNAGSCIGITIGGGVRVRLHADHLLQFAQHLRYRLESADVAALRLAANGDRYAPRDHAPLGGKQGDQLVAEACPLAPCLAAGDPPAPPPLPCFVRG